jgi:hypothetical protein
MFQQKSLRVELVPRVSRVRIALGAAQDVTVLVITRNIATTTIELKFDLSLLALQAGSNPTTLAGDVDTNVTWALQAIRSGTGTIEFHAEGDDQLQRGMIYVEVS